MPIDFPLNQPAVLSVSEVTQGLREHIESAYGDIVIEGELSNFKRASSGHCYFTLKDTDAQLRSVMWRTSAAQLNFRPQDGMLVRASGYVSLYEPRGDVQLIARAMQLAGEGALQQAFERLKRKLLAEGLFETDRKRPLPALPQTIGIITSGTGAALHDILSILERRFPQVNALVCPVRVQGVGSAEMIAEAIEAFTDAVEDGSLTVDLLIVGRGGGSAEDLWAFNEEVVARAIAASSIPIISAVGHETDVSIADFVADVRAATPSMAAELAVPDRRDLLGLIQQHMLRMRESLERGNLLRRQRIQYLTGCYAFNSPIDRMRRLQQRADHSIGRLQRSLPSKLSALQLRVEQTHRQLTHAHPGRPLARGYVRVEKDGRVVTRAHDVHADEVVRLHFQDGQRDALITDS